MSRVLHGTFVRLALYTNLPAVHAPIWPGNCFEANRSRPAHSGRFFWLETGFLFGQAETVPVAAGCFGMIVDRLFALLSLGTLALIVAAPLWQ